MKIEIGDKVKIKIPVNSAFNGKVGKVIKLINPNYQTYSVKFDKPINGIYTTAFLHCELQKINTSNHPHTNIFK